MPLEHNNAILVTGVVFPIKSSFEAILLWSQLPDTYRATINQVKRRTNESRLAAP